MESVRYQLKLAYDGTHFKGFQRQAENRTVQLIVEHALRKLGWTGNSIPVCRENRYRCSCVWSGSCI